MVYVTIFLIFCHITFIIISYHIAWYIFNLNIFELNMNILLQDQPLATDQETLRMIVYIGCAITMVFLLITLLILQFIRYGAIYFGCGINQSVFHIFEIAWYVFIKSCHVSPVLQAMHIISKFIIKSHLRDIHFFFI